MSQLGPVSEVRTQIYLPARLHRRVKQQSQDRGVSMARIIRETLEEKFLDKENTQQRDKDWNEFMKLAGFIKGKSPKDMATNHGKYWAESIYKNMLKNRRKR